MESTEYTQLAIVTESRPEKLNFNRAALASMILALSSAAEVADKLKRHQFYGEKGAISPTDGKFAHLLQTTGLMFTMLGRAVEQGGVALMADNTGASGNTVADPNLRILHAALGTFSESGEILEALSKQIDTGELDMVNVGEEGGDVLWYQAILADETGVSMAQNMETNIAKLKKRYGDKFSAHAATNRDLAGERAVLESGLAANEAANDDSAQQAA